MNKKYTAVDNEIFHVHTFRCKHAEDIADSAYVEKAIELNAPRIVFTDHCPFEGNKIPYRMNYEELDDYVESISNLKKEYADKIEVLCGLEIEYLPSHHDYYKKLRESGKFDLLIIGQHFFEYNDGHLDIYDKDRSKAYMGICDATVKGIRTGLFDVVAHPDRAFRKKESFDNIAQFYAKKVIDAAVKENMYLEKNYTSMSSTAEKFYWEEFWNMVPPNGKILYGYDAHYINEMVRFNKMSKSIN